MAGRVGGNESSRLLGKRVGGSLFSEDAQALLQQAGERAVAGRLRDRDGSLRRVDRQFALPRFGVGHSEDHQFIGRRIALPLAATLGQAYGFARLAKRNMPGRPFAAAPG